MRLLLVEDSKRLQRSLSDGLTRNGYSVDVVGNGEEALAMAVNNRYQIMVLDIMLPGLDGLEVLRRLRDSGDDTHVLILTARDNLDDKLRGFSNGADDYLAKPFALEELLARLSALTRRTSGRKNPQLKVGDIVVDTTARRVTRAGTEIALPAREYALLALLASRPGHVVSRAEIEAELYDGKKDPASNVVDAAIYGLRARVDPGNGSSYIETRRGLGWVLRPLP